MCICTCAHMCGRRDQPCVHNPLMFSVDQRYLFISITQRTGYRVPASPAYCTLYCTQYCVVQCTALSCVRRHELSTGRAVGSPLARSSLGAHAPPGTVYCSLYVTPDAPARSRSRRVPRRYAVRAPSGRPPRPPPGGARMRKLYLADRSFVATRRFLNREF